MEDKRQVVIFGAGHGLGRAIATLLEKESKAVVVVDGDGAHYQDEPPELVKLISMDYQEPVMPAILSAQKYESWRGKGKRKMNRNK